MNMRAKLVFRTRKNKIITQEIEIEPSLKLVEGIYDDDVYLFQMEMVGIQWIPGPPESKEITSTKDFEDSMDQLLGYASNMGFLELNIPPKKDPPEDDVSSRE